MIGWLLDRLFGKRYRKGWPRGVKPLVELETMRVRDPALYEETKNLPFAEGLRVWAACYPDMMGRLFPRWFPQP